MCRRNRVITWKRSGHPDLIWSAARLCSSLLVTDILSYRWKFGNQYRGPTGCTRVFQIWSNRTRIHPTWRVTVIPNWFNRPPDFFQSDAKSYISCCLLVTYIQKYNTEKLDFSPSFTRRKEIMSNQGQGKSLKFPHIVTHCTVVSASGGQGNCEKCNCPAYKTGLCDFGICVEFTSRDVITTKVTIVSV